MIEETLDFDLLAVSCPFILILLFLFLHLLTTAMRHFGALMYLLRWLLLLLGLIAAIAEQESWLHESGTLLLLMLLLLMLLMLLLLMLMM